MELSELVRLAIREDVGSGDLTTRATVPSSAQGSGLIRAKSRLVVCGHREASEVFHQMSSSEGSVQYEVLVGEGQLAQAGQPVARLSGSLARILTGERLALNFLMHLSGIATHTANTVAALPDGANLRVVDTRKTAPLLREPQRRAVCIGGGANHRFALYDGILIKDNHIVAAGGIEAAVQRARKAAHHLLRIEVEVESVEQAVRAVEAGADVVMLDNMDDQQVEMAIERLRGSALFEVSGNITAERLPRLAALGVDVVSIGGLIHQARWADLSLKLNPLTDRRERAANPASG
ncbi:MAG: nicotinate-nucleotide diphosphorylase (carboxylating) [Deltaproteobacteria bacterium]|nr:nicotinate-nucleotide diphosphorylase (carboxylating) [Deltaproteobacteria bacterium]